MYAETQRQGTVGDFVAFHIDSMAYDRLRSQSKHTGQPNMANLGQYCSSRMHGASSPNNHKYDSLSRSMLRKACTAAQHSRLCTSGVEPGILLT